MKERSELLINLGAKLIRENPSKGEKLIKAGIRLNPTASIAWYNLGLTLHEQKKIEQAIRSYRISLEYKDMDFKITIENVDFFKVP